MSDWSQVGGDPAPGDAAALQERAAAEARLEARLHDVAHMLGSISQDVASLSWTGSAADSTANKLHEVILPLTGLRLMHHEVSTTVGSYVQGLVVHQARARDALQRFQAASDALTSAAQRESEARSQAQSHQLQIIELESQARFAELNPLQDPGSLSQLYQRLRVVRSEHQDAVGRERLANQQRASAAIDRASALSVIEAVREEHARAARMAAQAVYDAAGLQAPSSNPFIHFGENVVHGYTQVVNSDNFEIFLESCDKVASEVSVVSTVLSFIPIPVVQEIAIAITVTVDVIKVIRVAGYAARAANGKEEWGDVRGMALGTAADIGLDALGSATLLSKAAKHGGPEAFDSALGMFKRASYYHDASQATGVLHSSVHVVPKLDKLPEALGQTYMSIATVAKSVGTGKSVIDSVDTVVEGVYDHVIAPSASADPVPPVESAGR